MANLADPAHAARVLDLVGEALDLPPDERAAFLQSRCRDNPILRQEIESLLRYQPPDTRFLEQPAFVIHPDTLRDTFHGELRAGDVLGDCRIESLLGEGGMGEVYLAEDTVLGRQVAVKLLKRHLGDEASGRRFRHERRVLGSLTHPGIARLYGAAASPQGRSYLVMEYVEGERLDRYCDHHGLGVYERLALFRQICAAVSYAHQHLVIHRDLKPANVRVTPEGEPKLLDFGIAKLLESDPLTQGDDHTLTLGEALTPEYASPEQLRGEPITTASDVYSLGVILYELLAGQRPYRFKSRRPDEIARAICETEPPRPSAVLGRQRAEGKRQKEQTGPTADRHLPGWSKVWRFSSVFRPSSFIFHPSAFGDLDNIVAMAMRKEPARRYASVAQFSEDIRRHCDGLPVQARRDTVGYRTGKFVRRNKTAVAAAVLVMGVLLGGLATTSWQARVARQERDRARLAQSHAERAEEQAERLNHFLQTLLGSVNPDAGVGRDLKVVEVLDRASREIDRELGADPAILAQAHLTLGRAYTGLKDADPAIRQLRLVVDLDQRLYGPESLVTARAEQALGVAIAGLQRQYSAAEPWLRAALTVIRRQAPADQGDLPELFKYLGLCLGASKQFAEAAALAEESLALARKTYGEQSQPYAEGLSQLGYGEMHTGDFAGAEAAFPPGASIYRPVAAGAPLFARSVANLAFALGMQGKLDEPESLLQEALTCYRATVGENSSNYHIALGLHGLLHFARGDYPTAEADLRQGLAYLRPLVPKSDRDVASGMVALGLTLTREGKAAEGETWLRDSLDLARTYHITGMASPPNVEAALAECLLAQKRYAEAEPLLLANYARLKTQPGVGDQKILAAGRQLQALYTAWNKPTEARRFEGPAATPVVSP